MISTSESLRCKQIIQELKDEIETKVFGKGHQVEFALLAAITQGHLLIEDVPGVGKTTLARTLAQGLGGSFQIFVFQQCNQGSLPVSSKCCWSCQNKNAVVSVSAEQE